jgi:NADH:ubiquinone oxidoreductase subunit 6 (subunit J)
MPPVLGADPGWLVSLKGLANLWPLWLPLLAGGLAIYLLLPRPRAYPWFWGALAGVAALVLGGAFLVRAAGLNPETVLFYAFSAIAVSAGALLVTQHNPARAALSFALVILAVCGLFLLLAAPFLMAATIIVYAGAIIVTFLFVLMLAQQEGMSSADNRSREPLLATLTGFVLLAALLYVLKVGYDTREVDALLARVREALDEKDPKRVGELVSGSRDGGDDLFEQSMKLLNSHGWRDIRQRAENLTWDWSFAIYEKPEVQRKPLLKLEGLLQEARDRLGTVQPPAGAPLSALSGPPANAPAGEVRRGANGMPELPAENSSYLGQSLFTDFLLPVELGGTLLLVAAIGAIAIGQRHGVLGGASRHLEATPGPDGPSGRTLR